MNVWVPEPLYKAVPWLSLLIGCLLIITTPSQFYLVVKWVAVVFFFGYALYVICARLSYKGEYSILCAFPKEGKHD